jgi:hypothetical protein
LAPRTCFCGAARLDPDGHDYGSWMGVGAVVTEGRDGTGDEVVERRLSLS